MTAVFPFGFDVTVQRPGGFDRSGKPLPSVDHTVSGCAAAPAGSTEYVNGVSTVIDKDTLYAPPGADIKATDLVVVPAGQAIDPGTYNVDGRAQQYVNPFTGDAPGTVVRLNRGTG